MKAVHPYLNFNGNTEEAFNFYKDVFGGEFLDLIRFNDRPEIPGIEKMSKEDQEKIMHMALPIGKDNILMATDALESMGQSLTVGNNVYIYLEAESEEEAERLFNGLVAGGEIEMSLQKTEWAEKFGSCVDKFGVQWMVNYTGSVQFSGKRED